MTSGVIGVYELSLSCGSRQCHHGLPPAAMY